MVTYLDCADPIHGCPWPLDRTCLGSEWDEASEAIQELAVGLASATLHRLTGFRVGGCPLTVRPCSQTACADLGLTYSGGTWQPYINGAGAWVNSCGCGASCGCQVIGAIVLPGVVSISSVNVGGVVVDPAEYHLVEDQLVSLGDPWPTTQDMTAPDGAVGTFTVTYLDTYPVDRMGANAAALLAMEFVRACGDGECSLPRGVKSVTRLGVSYDLVVSMFPDGQTQIPLVDAYIGLWNPSNLRQAPAVYSPDMCIPTSVRSGSVNVL